MAKKTFGLSAAELGTIEADGGISTAFSAVGETVSGTAQLTTEDNTTTDFNIEEADSPIETIVTQFGKIQFVWSTYKIDAATLYKFFGGTKTDYLAAGRILTLGSVTGGTGYVNGTYNNVPLTGGAGSGATANIVVAGTAVTTVTIVNRGAGYVAANSLSAAAASLGGTGSGFAVPVATVGTLVEEMWEAPDQFPDIELSVRLTTKTGNVIKIPRAKISPKFSVSLTKDKLGQIDLVATVLQPAKSGEKRLTMVFAQ